MSNRFHPKYHRHNHHTATNSVNPDAGQDPIASHESPFLGDFVLKGALSAKNLDGSYGASFFSNNTALYVQSPQTALRSDGNVILNGDVYLSGYLNGPHVQYCQPIEYVFGKGLHSYTQGTSCIVDSCIDNLSIKICESTNAMYVDFNAIGCIGETYNFGPGFTKTLLGRYGNNGSEYTIALNIDTNTLCFTQFGQLSVAKNYTFTDGLTSTNNRVGVNTDNSTVKIVNGKLVSGIDFASDGGISKEIGTTENLYKINTDNCSIKIVNNFLTNALCFSGPLYRNGGVVSIKTDDSTICKVYTQNSTYLEAYNVLKTNSNSVQSIQGPVSYKNQLFVNSIVFPDNSVLTSAGFLSQSGGIFISVPKFTILENIPTNSGAIITTTEEYKLFGMWNNNIQWPPATTLFPNIDIAEVPISATHWASYKPNSNPKIVQNYAFVLTNNNNVWMNSEDKTFTQIASDATSLYAIPSISPTVSGHLFVTKKDGSVLKGTCINNNFYNLSNLSLLNSVTNVVQIVGYNVNKAPSNTDYNNNTSETVWGLRTSDNKMYINRPSAVGTAGPQYVRKFSTTAKLVNASVDCDFVGEMCNSLTYFISTDFNIWTIDYYNNNNAKLLLTTTNWTSGVPIAEPWSIVPTSLRGKIKSAQFFTGGSDRACLILDFNGSLWIYDPSQSITTFTQINNTSNIKFKSIKSSQKNIQINPTSTIYDSRSTFRQRFASFAALGDDGFLYVTGMLGLKNQAKYSHKDFRPIAVNNVVDFEYLADGSGLIIRDQSNKIYTIFLSINPGIGGSSNVSTDGKTVIGPLDITRYLV